MDKIFIDTNVIVRFLVGDHLSSKKKAIDILLSGAEKNTDLVTSHMVIAELVYVLGGYYGLTKQDVAEKIISTVTFANISIPDWSSVVLALVRYVELNVDIEDALIVGEMEKAGITKVTTFDKKHFSRFERVEVVSPDT